MFAEGTEFIAESKNRYVIAKRIGNGAFGTVFRVKMKLEDDISENKSALKSKE
jgi:hypothetical protein